ncbi:MAG TPA: hypothetical protein PK544_08420 [Spirochaetota bacterium]|nr:hypothetical protein [Spirochaetota bacterium]
MCSICVILAGFSCSGVDQRGGTIRPGPEAASGAVYYQLPALCTSRMKEGREITACIRITLKLDSPGLRHDVEGRMEAVSDIVRAVLRSAPESVLNNVDEYEEVRNSITVKLRGLPGMAGVRGVLIQELSFRTR